MHCCRSLPFGLYAASEIATGARQRQPDCRSGAPGFGQHFAIKMLTVRSFEDACNPGLQVGNESWRGSGTTRHSLGHVEVDVQCLPGRRLPFGPEFVPGKQYS